MTLSTPQSPEELAQALADASASRQSIRLGGNFSKDAWGGPIGQAGTIVSTRKMRRVLLYEPRDLTISVEAGLPYRELNEIVAANNQMIPLDPPGAEEATIGGVIAANLSGPRRRLYGTARDLVIGMTFATLEGKLVQSGGMVVKNVAGLDMAKMMIGSFGTLAAIASVNFKLTSAPAETLTIVQSFATAEALAEGRVALTASPLQPMALDWLSPAAAEMAGLPPRYTQLVQAGGSPAVLQRYTQALSGDTLQGAPEARLWQSVQEFTPRFLAANRQGAVVRVPSYPTALRAVMESCPGPVVTRAGMGVCYAGFSSLPEATAWMQGAVQRGWRPVVECAMPAAKAGVTLWPVIGSDFAMMEKVKQMFDPLGLLNSGRLYGRI